MNQERFERFQDSIMEILVKQNLTPDELATYLLVLGTASRLGVDRGKVDGFNQCVERGVNLYNLQAGEKND